MRNPEYLTNLGLFVDQEAQVLICFRDECEYALCVKGSRVTTHLRDKHNIPEEARKGLTRFLKTIPQPSLRDPDKATPRADGSPEHDLLRVYDGFACSKCGFRTISLQSMRRHFSDPLSSQCPNYVIAQGRRDIDELFEYVFLQTWATGPNREYWIIERHGSLIRPVDSQDIQDHLRSVLEREHNRDQGSSDMSLEQAGPISTALTFAEQRPWIERTGWDETYKDSDRREVLAALIEMPSQSQGQAHILGRRGVCGLGGDLLSPADDEWKIAAILNMVDAMLDRCEETARKTSRSILCWLRSNRALSTYPKPFTLVRNLSTTRKYRLLFKRCIALEFRAYRMSRSIRESVAGIKLNRKQLRFLERIWNHESWVVFGSDGLHKTLPYPQHEYVIGDDVNCSEDGGDDEDDDDDDDDVEEDDQEEDSDEEFLTEEDEEDLIAANQCEDTVIEGSPDELLELLLGLSLALATEPLIDGQPSSTVLIYFSGILGFSQRSKAFLPARSYTPHLSGLIYVLRLLFLERALPLRAYPTLGITRRPRIKQLERLEPIRKRYMVMGSQSPFEELISLRNFGRVMSQSDTPPFLLRWSDDGQKVSLGDKIEISMGQFRLLPEHFIEEATRLCTELMFGWDPAIDFARIKDDISNHENGFSFVLHPENKLDKAYLELCDRACKARRNALFRRDSWDWSAIFRYFKKEEAFRGAALGCLDCAGGQKPRCSELLSLYCVNGEFGPRGIYIYNRSMMYVVRHHKAKRSTNREFIVARFLPAQVGFLLYKYLVYVRPFVDMLHRERRDGLHTGGTGSPLLFRLDANLGSKPWQTGRLTAILKSATLKVWGKSVNSQQFRQLCIGITEKHVREVHQPFNRFDDKSERADRNVVFAWQSGHRPLQRASTYGLDGAFPTKLQPQLLELYQWASSRWHEFLHLPSHVVHVQAESQPGSLGAPLSLNSSGEAHINSVPTPEQPASVDLGHHTRSVVSHSDYRTPQESSTLQRTLDLSAKTTKRPGMLARANQEYERMRASTSVHNQHTNTHVNKRSRRPTVSVIDMAPSPKRTCVAPSHWTAELSNADEMNAYVSNPSLSPWDSGPLFGRPGQLDTIHAMEDRQATVKFLRGRHDNSENSAKSQSLVRKLGVQFERWRVIGCQLCFVSDAESHLDHDLSDCKSNGCEKAQLLLSWLENVSLERFSGGYGYCSLCVATDEICRELTVADRIGTADTDERKAYWRNVIDSATGLDGLCNNKGVVRKTIAALCAYDNQILGKALAKFVSDKRGVDLTVERQAAQWCEQQVPLGKRWIPQILIMFDLLVSASDFLRSRRSRDQRSDEEMPTSTGSFTETDEVCELARRWNTADEVADWKVTVDWWVGKCSFCAGRGLRGRQIQHTMRSCGNGGKSQLRKDLGEAIYREGFWVLGGCPGCAMPRDHCQAWSQQGAGAWKRDLTVKCQYGRQVYDTILGFFYCKIRKYREEVLEAMMDDGFDDLSAEGVATWLGRKITVSGVESSQLMRQLKSWTDMIG